MPTLSYGVFYLTKPKFRPLRACVEMTLSSGEVSRRCFAQAAEDFPELLAPAAESDRSIRGCYNVNNNLVSEPSKGGFHKVCLNKVRT